MNDYTDKTFFLSYGVSPMWKITLKQRVQFLLASKCWTQNELARQCEITHGTLSKILNENWIPTAKIKLKMSQILGVDSLILFGDKKYFEDYQTTIKKSEALK